MAAKSSENENEEKGYPSLKKRKVKTKDKIIWMMLREKMGSGRRICL